MTEDNFDPSTVKKLSFKEIMKKIGPGIILSGIVIGPGAITTAANLGASYGYSQPALPDLHFSSHVCSSQWVTSQDQEQDCS